MITICLYLKVTFYSVSCRRINVLYKLPVKEKDFYFCEIIVAIYEP